MRYRRKTHIPRMGSLSPPDQVGKMLFMTGLRIVFAVCATGIAWAQPKAPPAAPPAPAPRLPSVDFTGLWRPADIFLIEDIALGLKLGESVPVNAWAQAEMKKHLSKDDPEANCLPMGVPRQAPYPWKFVETPPYIYIL